MSKLTHLQSLTALTVAGEEFQISHYEKIRKEFSGTVVNAYGVNETTVYNIVNSFESGAPFKNTLGQILRIRRNLWLMTVCNCCHEVPLGISA
jgi:N-(5-amino-5-carboxypentanoyl)-L-cysteinyl-D-valine synthase